jgi:hypothetical protein
MPGISETPITPIANDSDASKSKHIRAAPVSLLRWCRKERERAGRGAIHQRSGARLAIPNTCSSAGHPVLGIKNNFI